MTMPNDSAFVEPDEVVSDTSPEPVDVIVSPDALEAARAEVAQERADSSADVTARSLRTLGQAVIAAALVAGVQLYVSGVHDWKALAFVGVQAAVTVLVTYFHGKVMPAKR